MDKQELIDALNDQSKIHYAHWRNAVADSTESAVELALADAFESLARSLS